ncbi:hypothetical protein CRYUN_Cryun29cG0106600 [Craigia yunnanensis]
MMTKTIKKLEFSTVRAGKPGSNRAVGNICSSLQYGSYFSSWESKNRLCTNLACKSVEKWQWNWSVNPTSTNPEDAIGQVCTFLHYKGKISFQVYHFSFIFWFQFWYRSRMFSNDQHLRGHLQEG